MPKKPSKACAILISLLLRALQHGLARGNPFLVPAIDEEAGIPRFQRFTQFSGNSEARLLVIHAADRELTQHLSAPARINGVLQLRNQQPPALDHETRR